MLVGIVGAGAIGSAFAEGLRQVTTVRMAGRSDAPALGLADADVVLVAVKAYDTVGALQPLRGILRPNVPLVSLQNGIDQVTQVTAALGSSRPIVLAPTTEAAGRDPSGVIRRTVRGRTTLGWVADRGGDFDLLAFIALLRKAGFDAYGGSPIEPHVWAKLIAHASIDPIAALAGKPNGYVVEHRAASALAIALAREAAAVAAAEGVTLPFEDPAAHVLEFASATAEQRSPTLQDLERGRPLEIEATNGAILRRGRARGIPTPEHARVIDEVRRLIAVEVRR
jgi:2-dehydropantoate 2-reductase